MSHPRTPEHPVGDPDLESLRRTTAAFAARAIRFDGRGLLDLDLLVEHLSEADAAPWLVGRLLELDPTVEDRTEAPESLLAFAYARGQAPALRALWGRAYAWALAYPAVGDAAMPWLFGLAERWKDRELCDRVQATLKDERASEQALMAAAIAARYATRPDRKRLVELVQRREPLGAALGAASTLLDLANDKVAGLAGLERMLTERRTAAGTQPDHDRVHRYLRRLRHAYGISAPRPEMPRPVYGGHGIMWLSRP